MRKRVLWSQDAVYLLQQENDEPLAVPATSQPLERDTTKGKSAGRPFYNANETYESVFQRYSSKPVPKSFFQLVSNSLVVVQEFCLTCFLLARHRIASWEESELHKSFSRPPQLRLVQSNYAIFSALVVAVIYSSCSDPTKQQDRRVKARQRTIDALLLALLLRLFASVLRSLTASYSSDTVQVLALAGMLLHLVTCDYTYANGMSSSGTTTTTPQQQQQRPAFHGGTVALNGALFSVTLLVSRLASDLSTYFFCSLAVILFAFYSATRHAISSSYPPSSSGAVWIITSLSMVSTSLLLLDDTQLLWLFWGISLALGLVLPAWKFLLQSKKIMLKGPWVIPSAATMQLDFQGSDRP